MIALVLGCKSPGTRNKSGGDGETAKTSLKGNFNVCGAYALYPLITKLADSFMETHPDVRIEVTRMGTGEGITALLSKKCQVAMISRPLTDEEINEGIWVIPIAKDGVAPIVNQKNPYVELLLSQGLSPQEFLQIFTSGKELTWGFALGTQAKEKIRVYVRNDESGAADVFAEFIYKKATDLKGIGVTGDDEMIRSIQEDPFGIGFCNFTYAFDVATGERKMDIQVIPSDLDFDNKIDKVEVPFANLEAAHRSLWLGFYPDQLCRELTLGCLGKPTDPAVVAFLRYVLGDGQTEVKKSGYCPLNNIYINYSLELLK